MNLDKKPLPRFWYFPRGEEAVIIMTGDDHAGGQTNQYFDYFKQESPQGCSVADWECIRGTSYMYPNTPLSDAQAKAYQDDGFEVALHVQTGCTSPWTAENLEDYYRTTSSRFRAKFPSVEPPTTNRTHCIAWSDWVTQPKVELDNGIRLDTNYYYYPGPWIKNRAGMFTGSGMPMRFADKDGSMIDVYQSTTQMIDEWGTGGSRREVLIDNAIGGQASSPATALAPQGYYGAFTANMHTDRPQNLNNNDFVKGIVQYAKQHGVPVVTSQQMLHWLDARNGSSFEDLSWNADSDELSFTVAADPAARGLQAMVPARSDTGALTGLTRDGAQVNISRKTIKGVEYAFFPASAGDYVATYGEVQPDTDSAGHLGAGGDASGRRDSHHKLDHRRALHLSRGVRHRPRLAEPERLRGGAGYLPQRRAHRAGAWHHLPLPRHLCRRRRQLGDLSARAARLRRASRRRHRVSPTRRSPTSRLARRERTPTSRRPPMGRSSSSRPWAPSSQARRCPAGGRAARGRGGNATVSNGSLSVDGARANTSALYDPGHSLEFVATFGGDHLPARRLRTDPRHGPVGHVQHGRRKPARRIVRAHQRANGDRHADNWRQPEHAAPLPHRVERFRGRLLRRRHRGGPPPESHQCPDAPARQRLQQRWYRGDG